MTERPHRRALPSIAILAAAVALLTSVATLLFTVRPELAPDPRIRIGASVGSATIDTDVTRAQFFAAVEPDDLDHRHELEDQFLAGVVNAANPTARQIEVARSEGALHQRGSIVYVDAAGQGLKHQRVTLYWFVYDASTRRRTYGGGAGIVRLEAPDDQFVLPTFVDTPINCRMRIFVRLELRDEHRTLLAIGSTKPFRSCRRVRRT
jgi:hypothetical protein